MRREDRPLEVKAVRKARAPGYPGHRDPNPTEFPVPVPFPFGRKLVTVVGSIGLAAMLRAASAEEAAPAEKKGEKPVPENPLSIAKSGLPHSPSMFGTGEPMQMNVELSRELVARLFAGAGYKMEERYAYKKDGVGFIVDGYDPQRRIGFVFADEQSLDHDGVESWYDQQVAAQETELERELRLRRRTMPGELRPALEAAEKTVDPAKREAAMLAVLRQDADRHLSLDEAAKLEEGGDAKPREFIAIISTWDDRFRAGWSDPDFAGYREAAQKIQNIVDPAKRRAAEGALERKLSEKALSRLEQSVHEFLEWAERQGM